MILGRILLGVYNFYGGRQAESDLPRPRVVIFLINNPGTGNVVTGPQTKSMNVGNYLLEASATLALDNSYVGRVFRKTFDVYCSEVTSKEANE